MVLSLAACGDRPQTMDATGKKTDAQAWSVSERANPAYKLPGWKAGDKTSWENELRQRAQAQNDYAR
ncbi:MAG: hypothetical protein H7Y61_17155 [Rhizobiales bacterium]|nr:hypothetical protein [Rhizobacter sp.]